MGKNWFLVANPSRWKFEELKTTQREPWTLIDSETGKSRKISQNFRDAEVGDNVIGYETGTGIVAICRVCDKQNDTDIFIEGIGYLSNPITFDQLKNKLGLQSMEFIKNKGGTLFRITPDEYKIINEMIQEKGLMSGSVSGSAAGAVSNPAGFQLDGYDRDAFLKDVYMKDTEYDELVGLLKNKKI